MPLAPLSVIVLGLVILLFVGIFGWNKNIHQKTIDWCAKNIYRNSFRAESLANGLVSVVMSVMLAVGGLLIVYGSLFFNN